MKAGLTYKIIYSQAPVALTEIFENSQQIYNLRNNEYKLYLPKPNTEYLKKSIGFCGAKLNFGMNYIMELCWGTKLGFKCWRVEIGYCGKVLIVASNVWVAFYLLAWRFRCCRGALYPVSSIYIWSENLVAESEAKNGGN